MSRNNYLLRVVVALDTLLAGGLGYVALGSPDFSRRGLEAEISKPVAQVESVKRREDSIDNMEELEELKRLEQEYGFLDVYNETIDDSTAYFSSRLGLNDLERNWFKGMIFDETGSIAHRQTAFVFDPMQIANKGDYALEGLEKGTENTRLIGDFSNLKGKKHTARGTKTIKVKRGKGKDAKLVDKVVGFWDYSDSNMEAESSIYGGMGWMLNYRSRVNTKIVEEGEVSEYKIRDGDNFEKIAGDLGTTVDTLRKYNPEAKPEKLQIGQKVIYVKARTERYISGWGTMQDAITRYNGGGNPNYFEEVSAAKKDLDRLDILRNKYAQVAQKTK